MPKTHSRLYEPYLPVANRSAALSQYVGSPACFIEYHHSTPQSENELSPVSRAKRAKSSKSCGVNTERASAGVMFWIEVAPHGSMPSSAISTGISGLPTRCRKRDALAR